LVWPNSAYGGADGYWGANAPHGYGMPVGGYHGYGYPVSGGHYGYSLSGCGCPSYGGYGYYPTGYGYNFALIVVLFILLIIVGTVYVY